MKIPLILFFYINITMEINNNTSNINNDQYIINIIEDENPILITVVFKNFINNLFNKIQNFINNFNHWNDSILDSLFIEFENEIIIFNLIKNIFLILMIISELEDIVLDNFL